MTLCAMALGHDASFVALHHTVRIMAVTLVMPVAFGLLHGRGAAAAGGGGGGEAGAKKRE